MKQDQRAVLNSEVFVCEHESTFNIVPIQVSTTVRQLEESIDDESESTRRSAVDIQGYPTPYHTISRVSHQSSVRTTANLVVRSLVANGCLPEY
jgi:hypothetical protein